MIQNLTPEEKTLQETKMKPQEADFATDELQNETTSELIFGKFKSMEEASKSGHFGKTNPKIRGGYPSL